MQKCKPRFFFIIKLMRSKITLSNYYESGISLVVEWLRLHAPTAGGQVRPLVRELDPTCCN